MMRRSRVVLTLALVTMAISAPRVIRAGAADERQSPQGGGGRGAAAAPRGRSVTLGDVTDFEVKDNVFTVTAGQDQIRVIFYRDDIFRIWLGPDGAFTEAQPNAADAQMVVFKGAAIAVAWKDAGDYYEIDERGLRAPRLQEADRQRRPLRAVRPRQRRARLAGDPLDHLRPVDRADARRGARPSTSTAAACRTATSRTATRRSTSA